jgi:peptidoglycan/LPS O-acetylase OafA/YrhL
MDEGHLQMARASEDQAKLTSRMDLRPKVHEIRPLTSLRFFAALTVVISHLHGTGFIDAQALHDFFDGGRPAVAFFFVLSGFILYYNYPAMQTSQARKSFWSARFARLYPIHLFGLGIALATALAALQLGKFEQVLSLYSLKKEYTVHGVTLGASVLLAGSFIGQLLLLSAWLPMASLNQPWNGPAWSISCETFFYAIFPKLSQFISTLRTKHATVLIFIAWILQITLIEVLKYFEPRTHFVISQFPITHAFEFALGIYAASELKKGTFNKFSDYTTGILLTCATMIGGISFLAPFSPLYAILSPLFAILISCVAIDKSWLAKSLSVTPLVKLGEASYSLYIIHIPILTTAIILSVRAPGWIMLLGLVAASLIAHHYLEEPARIALRRRLAGDSALAQSR